MCLAQNYGTIFLKIVTYLICFGYSQNSMQKNAHSVAFNLEGTCRPNTFRVNERRNWGTLRVEWAANVGKLSYVGKVHGAPQELHFDKQLKCPSAG